MNNRPFSSLSSPLHWGAFKIAGLYLLIGSLWILFSDRLAERIALNKEMLASLSLYKGWAYVIVTAFLLYWLIQRDTGRLHASEKQLQVVINALPVLISYVDKNRHYQFTNEAYEEWFGEKAQGKRIEELIGEATYQKISKYVDKALNGETVFYETEIPYQDGGERFVSATYIPDIQTDGQVRGFFALVQDISEQKESKEKLHQWADAFEGCAHGIAISDPDTNRIVVCNPAFANMHKCRVENIVGTSLLGLYAPSDHEHVRHNIERADQIGHVRFEAQMAHMGTDKSVFPVQMDLVSVLGEDGELIYRVATAQDISERKQAEEGLRRFELLSEHRRDMILFMRHKDGRILEANAAAVQAYGYSRQELLALTIQDLRASETLALTADQMTQANAGGILFETSHRRKDGTTFPVEVSSQGATIHGVQTLISIIRDITERKRSEEALQSSQEQLLLLIKQAPISIAMFDREMCYIVASQRWVAEYGRGYTDLIGRSHYEIHPDLPELWKDAHRRGLAGESLRNDNDIWTWADGTKNWLRWAIVPWRDSQGEIAGIIISAEDISEGKRVEEALHLKDELLRLTSEIAKVGGWEFDPETGKGTWTDEVARIHDLDPAQETNVEIGLSFYTGTSHEKVDQAIQEAIKLGKPYDLELEMVTAKGNHKWVRTMALPVTNDGRVIKVQGIFQDITERKQIQNALQKAHDELELKG